MVGKRTLSGMRLLPAVWVAGGLMSAGAAAAAPIRTFTYSGTASSGTLAGDLFGPTDYVVTGIGDTDDRDNFGAGYTITHQRATIDLDGIGSFRFGEPTQTFVNNPNRIVGFGLTTLDSVYAPTAAAFATYGLNASIGPISGTGQLLQWNFDDIRTSGGTLVLASGNSPATFEADDGTRSDPCRRRSCCRRLRA